jgi:hypothetical protein
VGRWTCPDCEREFANVHQSHVCAPGIDVEQVFAGRLPVQREIYDEIVGHLRTLGDVQVIRLATVDDVDEQVRDWLAEAFLAAEW